MNNRILRNSVYLLHNLRSAYGRYLLKYLTRFRCEMKLSSNELLGIRRERLQDMLFYAKNNSLYYKRVFNSSDPKEISSVSDLRSIPFLIRKTIQKQIEEIRCPRQARATKSFTGGSTGIPMPYYKDLRKEAMGAAFLRLAKESVGYKNGELSTRLWGAPIDLENKNTLSAKWHSFVYNEHLLNAFNMEQSQMKGYIQYISQNQVKLMVAYAQSAYQLAKYAIDNNAKAEIPRVILCAETTHDYQIKTVKKAFNCSVYLNYGCRELGNVANQREEGADYLVNIPGFIVEVVDNNGNIVKTGQKGYLVITDLWNIAMPFIRYWIGDMAIQGGHDELGSFTLKGIIGRSVDRIKTKSGKRVTGLMFVHLFTKGFEEVEEFQVTQNSLESINIKLVLNNKTQKDKLARRIRDDVKNMIDEAIDIDIEFVESIKKTPTGKYRPVICNLN